MVTNDRQLDLVFGALSDSTRRGILELLANGDRSVGELAEPFEISRPAISKHLRVLERARLVRRYGAAAVVMAFDVCQEFIPGL